MRRKGKAFFGAPIPSFGRGDKIVLVFDEVTWTNSKVTLTDVLRGNDEPIQVNKLGELVSGEINLLKYKALNPQAQTLEVSIAGYSQLPPISEISLAA